MNKKRLAAIVAVMVLASALSFGGAFAYLANTKSVNNVFRWFGRYFDSHLAGQEMFLKRNNHT